MVRQDKICILLHKLRFFYTTSSASISVPTDKCPVFNVLFVVCTINNLLFLISAVLWSVLSRLRKASIFNHSIWVISLCLLHPRPVFPSPTTPNPPDWGCHSAHVHPDCLVFLESTTQAAIAGSCALCDSSAVGFGQRPE